MTHKQERWVMVSAAVVVNLIGWGALLALVIWAVR